MPAGSPGRNVTLTPLGPVPLTSRRKVDGATSTVPTLQEVMSSKTSTKQLVAFGFVMRVSHGILSWPYTQVRLTFTGHAGFTTGAKVGSDTGATVAAGIIVGGTTGGRVGTGTGAAVTGGGVMTGIKVGGITGGGVMTGIIVGGTGSSVGSGTGAVVASTVGVIVGVTGASVGTGTGANVGGGTGAGVARLSAT